MCAGCENYKKQKKKRKSKKVERNIIENVLKLEYLLFI